MDTTSKRFETKEDHIARWETASADPYAGAVGTIRGLTYRSELTEAEFRQAVIAVLDACEEVVERQFAAS